MAAAARLRRLRTELTGPATVGELNALLGREGVGLLVFFIAIPFLQPIPLAGIGTPIGLALMALGVQLTQGRGAPALPASLAGRKLEAETVARLLSGAERVLAAVESFAKPRGPALFRSGFLLGPAVVLLGLLLATPFYVPFGNPFTGLPLALIGLALMEEDGLMAGLGLLGTVITYAYHAAFAKLAWAAAKALFARF